MTPEIGQKLRQARIDRGLELSDVEQETKIRAKYLGAIEDERWDVLPGDPFNRGFLVSYADFLDLDPEPLVDEYKRLHAQAPEPTPIPETMLPQRAMVGRAPPGWRPMIVVLGLIAAAVVAVIAVIGLTRDSGDGGHPAGRAASSKPGGDSPTTTSATEPATPKPSRVSLELTATDSVWVCLVDDRDRRLVNAETLTAGQTRGPFKASAYKLTLGNGAVEMTVDREPVDVPDAGEPLGYRIKPAGVSELGPAVRPTCL
jgi:cytoskeleton protein RodZ